eukprot:scaffold51004_cov61-Phaeocystis_antarctica.AAC.9
MPGSAAAAALSLSLTARRTMDKSRRGLFCPRPRLVPSRIAPQPPAWVRRLPTRAAGHRLGTPRKRYPVGRPRGRGPPANRHRGENRWRPQTAAGCPRASRSPRSPTDLPRRRRQPRRIQRRL